MKANEAPEKLYFPIDDALETYARKDSDEEIEYTRTDAFVEKACEWIRDNYLKYPNEDCADTTQFVMDFRQYMEGV